MQQYLKNIAQKFARNDVANGREMIYRADFENLLKDIFQADGKVTQINHDSTSDNGNKPDFVISKNGVPILYIEAKDIGVSLDKIEKSNQMDRYFGYDNLVLTDYIEFRFYRNGQKYGEPVSIATFDKDSRVINEISENFSLLSKTLIDFASSHKEPIKSGKQLAKIMGGKAMRIRDNVREMLVSDTDRYADLTKMLDVVRENLVSSLDNETFADMYAQTLVYGLFAARYNDKSAESFSRAEARELVPKTNPFLRSFFDHIAGNTFPERLRFIVDELCEVFQHADVEKLLTDFYGKEKDNKDPIIHFYEDFLHEYDSKKKMEMGVFYTPKPVVSFIVGAVDSILKNEFGLARGLADSTKIKVDKLETDSKTGKQKKVQKEYHKVQVLDVATGTGTFLNEVIHNIHSSFAGQEGRWASYVENDLLPRLHGFELMMASYTIAHLKLGMTLHDTKAGELKTRLGVYLTNTLEAPVDYANQGTLFGLMDTIAEESKNASRIKSEFPIMCVIGNPPYSGESMNPNYTDNDVYKVEIGGKEKLKERNSKWINDDYVKFIRFAESLIEKNGEGVMGMITAHGYIDNPTFRGMRWHLRNTFDKIYVIDLHGNSRKKEVSPDGTKDENVFDIMTGVSIIFGIKKSNTDKKELAQVYKFDLFGLRKDKFKVLEDANFENVKWQKLPDETDLWVLEGKGKSKYMEGFSVAEIFPVNSVGVVTAKDKILIGDTKELLIKQIREYYKIEPDEKFIQHVNYRPFDSKYIYYDTKLVERSREKVMINLIQDSFKNIKENSFIDKENIGIVFKLGNQEENSVSCMVTDSIIDFRSWSRPGMQGGDYVAPAYIATIDNNNFSNIKSGMVSINLSQNFLSLLYKNKIYGDTEAVNPVSVIDYIYAILHSPKYRETYKEFLKIDFPRVPYPTDKKEFDRLVKLGTKLRGLHLMTDSDCENLITTYPESGSDIVEKVKYENGNVYINDTQYFGNVPEISWNFYIGGYQPAQKYLKDRKGRTLTSDEIHHYQKIIKVLFETDKLMKEIDAA